MEKFEDSFPYQCPSHDFGGNGHYALDWPFELSIQEENVLFDSIPLMEIADPLYHSLDVEPISSVKASADDPFSDMKNGLTLWNETEDAGFGSDESLLLLNENGESGNESLMSEEKNVCREKRRGKSACMLSRETISEQFYMPITQAAKQLKVGLTPLKKRCRQLGIQRWPHRKLKSLQTLINTVQELGKEGYESDEKKLRNAIVILEKEKKGMEEKPDLELDHNTKRLRQACFKANFKKRKLLRGL